MQYSHQCPCRVRVGLGPLGKPPDDKGANHFIAVTKFSHLNSRSLPKVWIL